MFDYVWLAESSGWAEGMDESTSNQAGVNRSHHMLGAGSAGHVWHVPSWSPRRKDAEKQQDPGEVQGLSLAVVTAHGPIWSTCAAVVTQASQACQWRKQKRFRRGQERHQLDLLFQKSWRCRLQWCSSVKRADDWTSVKRTDDWTCNEAQICHDTIIFCIILLYPASSEHVWLGSFVLFAVWLFFCRVLSCISCCVYADDAQVPRRHRVTSIWPSERCWSWEHRKKAWSGGCVPCVCWSMLCCSIYGCWADLHVWTTLNKYDLYCLYLLCVIRCASVFSDTVYSCYTCSPNAKDAPEAWVRVAFGSKIAGWDSFYCFCSFKKISERRNKWQAACISMGSEMMRLLVTNILQEFVRNFPEGSIPQRNYEDELLFASVFRIAMSWTNDHGPTT